MVTPHGGLALGHRLANGVRKLLRVMNPELSTLWARRTEFTRLKRRLLALARRHSGGGLTIYAQDPLSAKAALAVKRAVDCRVVAVVHFNIAEAYEYRDKGLAREGSPLWNYSMAVEAETLPNVDHVIFVSEFMRKSVRERVPSIDRVRHSVIPNFCGEADELSAQGQVAGDILAIGTLEPRKNQGFLLEVLAVCRSRGKSYTLTLAGDGPDRAHLERQAQKLGIAEQVRFLGFVPAASRLLRFHRVLAHSAVMENLPITLVEALAYGRPIIAAPVGGIPEVFSDGIEGRYLDLSDASRAADTLMSMLDDEQTLERMNAAARSRYAQKFNRDSLSKRWIDVLTGGRE